MYYYQIEFDYYSSSFHTDSREAEEDLYIAEKEVNRILKETKVLFKHAYCWPDGSLYKFVKCTKEELEKVKDAFNNQSDICRIRNIREQEPTTNPYKHGCSTLEEYFNKTDFGEPNTK